MPKKPLKRTESILHACEKLFFATGVVSLVVLFGLIAHSRLLQLYDNWLFERGLRTGHNSVSSPHQPRLPAGKFRSKTRTNQRSLAFDPSQPLGRLEIPTIDLAVLVLEGTDRWTLNRAIGHIPGTARPGQVGNIGMAGHRDGFFRGLKDISENDEIILRTPERIYHYAVEDIRIVNPKDTHVLRSSTRSSLTLVTCFPFYFVGHAPKRFVVKARLIGET